MNSSILNTIKKLLGIDPNYQVYDEDILVAINSAISVLTQLGVTSDDGFIVDDESVTWGDLLQNANYLEFVKSYVYLKTRVLFDPPASASLLNAYNEELNRLEWRINVAVDPRMQGDELYELS